MSGDTSQVATPITDEIASYGVVGEEVLAVIRQRENDGELSSDDPQVQELLVQARGAVVDMKEAELEVVKAQLDFVDAIKEESVSLQKNLYRNVEGLVNNEAENEAKTLLSQWS